MHASQSDACLNLDLVLTSAELYAANVDASLRPCYRKLTPLEGKGPLSI